MVCSGQVHTVQDVLCFYVMNGFQWCDTMCIVGHLPIMHIESMVLHTTDAKNTGNFRNLTLTGSTKVISLSSGSS